MCEETNTNESIMSIGLVIGRYHGKGTFRAIIKLRAKFTSGRSIIRIFRFAHVH